LNVLARASRNLTDRLTVPLLLHVDSLLWKDVHCSIAQQWSPLLVPLFWLSAIISQYFKL
jgi:hypothetical protein